MQPQLHTYRVAFIHSEVHTRLGAKLILWEILRKVHGFHLASLVMPAGFALHNEEEFRLAKSQTRQQSGSPAILIVKEPIVHAQKGISMQRADALGPFNASRMLLGTLLLENPFTSHGFKVNLRRYVLLVCWEGRTLGILHDDAKNHWTRNPFVDPYSLASELVNDRILDGIVTTGYVPVTHYDKLPMRYRELRKQYDFSTIEETIKLRLGVVFHSLVTDEDHVCGYKHALKPNMVKMPSCLLNALRYQVYGCDFEVRKDMRSTRMHECNVGPDFSPHSPPDRDLKRDVASDFVAFMGLNTQRPDLMDLGRQKRHRVSIFYDSETFQLARAFDRLTELDQFHDKKEEL